MVPNDLELYSDKFNRNMEHSALEFLNNCMSNFSPQQNVSWKQAIFGQFEYTKSELISKKCIAPII